MRVHASHSFWNCSISCPARIRCKVAYPAGSGARGYGGQDCFVLEKQGMVAVFTGNIQFPAEMAREMATVMNSFVLPAYVGPEN